MEGRIEGRNWIQRHLIQKELAKRQHQQPPQKEEGKESTDPLLPVKHYYYQMYTEAIGQPGISPDSSPVHASAAAQISELVDKLAAQSEDTYGKMGGKFQDLPPYLHGDAEQYQNRIMAVLSHGSEAILEECVKWLAEDDPLLNSKLGRLIRRFSPSKRQKGMKKIADATKQEINNISRHFLREINRKYKR